MSRSRFRFCARPIRNGLSRRAVIFFFFLGDIIRGGGARFQIRSPSFTFLDLRVFCAQLLPIVVFWPNDDGFDLSYVNDDSARFFTMENEDLQAEIDDLQNRRKTNEILGSWLWRTVFGLVENPWIWSYQMLRKRRKWCLVSVFYIICVSSVWSK